MNKSVNLKLMAAYSRLVEKKDEKITVITLCEKADVSRASFYIYYNSLDEFVNKVSLYIIDKLFMQSVKIITCRDADLSFVIKKENLFFNEGEIKILRNMISGVNYIDFAILAESYYVDRKNDPLFSEEMWKNHKDEIDLFSRGYIPILLVNLINYDEINFKKDMKNCRFFFKNLHNQISEN